MGRAARIMSSSTRTLERGLEHACGLLALIARSGGLLRLAPVGCPKGPVTRAKESQSEARRGRCSGAQAATCAQSGAHSGGRTDVTRGTTGPSAIPRNAASIHV